MLKELLGIDKVLKEIKKTRKAVKENREEISQEVHKIPFEVWEQYKDINKVLEETVPKRIMNILENNNGKMNVSKLRNVCKEKGICSKNTFYKKLEKLKRKSLIVEEREGRKKYVRTSAETLLNLS